MGIANVLAALGSRGVASWQQGREKVDRLNVDDERFNARRMDQLEQSRRAQMNSDREFGLQSENAGMTRSHLQALIDQIAEKRQQAEAEVAATEEALIASGMEPTKAKALARDPAGARSYLQQPKPAPQPRALQHVQLQNGDIATFDPATGEVKSTGVKGREPTGPAGSFIPMIAPDGTTSAWNPTTDVRKDAPTDLRRVGAGGAEMFKRQQAVANVEDALNRFEKSVTLTGPTVMPGVDKAGLQTDYENVQLQLKELFNLGVLNGPDLMLMRRILSNPTSMTSRVTEGLGSAKTQQAAILEQIRRVREQLQSTKRNLQTGSGQAPANSRAPQGFEPPPGKRQDDEPDASESDALEPDGNAFLAAAPTRRKRGRRVQFERDPETGAIVAADFV